MWFWGLKVAVVCVTGVVLVVRTLFPILSFSYFLLLWWRDVVMNFPFLRPSIFSDFRDQCGPFQSLDVLARISPYFWFGKRRCHRPSPCPRCPHRLLPREFFRRKWTRLNKFYPVFSPWFTWWRMLSAVWEVQFPFWCWFVAVVAWDIVIIVQ